jgi:uncharacterized membrane protein YphA (DoxX/SURF4 family)
MLLRRSIMVRWVVAVFFVLHGLVHLLYLGQSQRFFELQPGMVWPDGSWAFSRIVGNEATRLLAAFFLTLAAIGFVAGGAGLIVRQAWWQQAVVGAAALSAVLFVLLWDGVFQNLNDRGALGLLINAGIVIAVLVFRWPDLSF